MEGNAFMGLNAELVKLQPGRQKVPLKHSQPAYACITYGVQCRLAPSDVDLTDCK